MRSIFTTPPAVCATTVCFTRPRSTGKERDTESGNDYFGARYYGSSMGRFRSPDWSSDLEAVPYASLGNPQSLNLYSYVQNNPLKSRDPDGHMHQECDAATYSYTTESTGTIHVSASQHCYGVYDLQDIRMMAGMALGHHGIPRSLFRFLPKGPARTWLEREFTTGPLDGPHYFDTAHRLYNKEVEKLLDLDTPEGRQELIDEGLDGVKKAAQRVLDSDNPNIKEFLDDMETPDGLTGRQALEGAMEGDAGALVDVIIDGAVGLAAVE